MGAPGRSSLTIGRLWSAEFTSRWPLTESQLDRWSAQVIGLLADALGADVRLGGWKRLEVADLGAPQVAYRYALIAASSPWTGEATVVFARGGQVGLAGTAALGRRPPVDAVALAHDLARRHAIRGNVTAYSSVPAPRPIPGPTRARRS